MHSKRASRRRHSQEIKALVLGPCAEPGASVAAVAQAHGLNANLVHKFERKNCIRSSTRRQGGRATQIGRAETGGPAAGTGRIATMRPPLSAHTHAP
jgi:transposase